MMLQILYTFRNGLHNEHHRSNYVSRVLCKEGFFNTTFVCISEFKYESRIINLQVFIGNLYCTISHSYTTNGYT